MSVAISRGKDAYNSQIGQKLSDPSASSKTYWSTLKKKILMGRKVPIMPPINNKLKSYFKIKAILTVPLLQNIHPLLTAALHLIR